MLAGEVARGISKSAGENKCIKAEYDPMLDRNTPTTVEKRRNMSKTRSSVDETC